MKITAGFFAGKLLRAHVVSWLILCPFLVHAQEEKKETTHYLKGIPGHAFAPLSGGYFLFGLECNSYFFSASAGEVHAGIPYSTDAGGSSAVFHGAASIRAQSPHMEARTMLNLEGKVGKGPAIVLKFSILSEYGIFGKFINLDYYEWALRYDFGLFPRKGAPRFILSPALGFAGHELDYSLGSDTISGNETTVLGRKFKIPGDSIFEMGYSSRYYLLHPAVGLWFLPSHHRRTDAVNSIALPYISFRLEAGYNILLFSSQSFCFASMHAHYTKIGKRQTTADLSPRQLERLNSFQGVTFGFTVLIRPYK